MLTNPLAKDNQNATMKTHTGATFQSLFKNNWRQAMTVTAAAAP